MVLDDPWSAIGTATVVFFVFLGVLYLWIPNVPMKTWWGVLFIFVGVTLIFFLLGQPGLGGVFVAVIAAMVAKLQIERRGFVK